MKTSFLIFSIGPAFTDGCKYIYIFFVVKLSIFSITQIKIKRQTNDAKHVF